MLTALADTSTPDNVALPSLTQEIRRLTYACIHVGAAIARPTHTHVKEAHALPAPADDDEMVNDAEYDYSDTDDQSSTGQQTKPSSIAKASMVPMEQQNSSVTVTGILGQNVVLKCDLKITKQNVVLWYQNDKIITNGNSVVLPNFSLNPSSYELTILQSSPQSAGQYSCQVLPQKVFNHVKVVLGDHSLDELAAESSKSSAQSSFQRFGFGFGCLWFGLLISSALLH
ncbi:uncharacterized protein LOC108596904 isoform X1 [Drosophila busckii]|uniref:uncharacterized protein LOC108596904 isoform X1 n=1 Tax=Drosophila busckii TaxID=30019 RepID=UPI00083EEC0C|nr:uncharacterized protein LOC108596904 isoform X1 [Drosophila busckii]